MGPKINLNAKLFAQKQINLFCDVVLIAKADKKRIRVHRCVLYAASEYFEALLTADMKEKDLEKIELDGVSGAVLGQLVDYVYTGHIDVNVANAHDILAAADLFLFEEVTQICERVLAGAIDTTNAFSFLAIAEKYRLGSLKDAAQTFVHNRFLDITGDEAFLGLEADTLVEYLANDELQIGSEKDIFEAIVKWISVDAMTRKKHYAALMTAVRMSKIDNMFLHCRILEFSEGLDMYRAFTDLCKEKYRQDVKSTDAERKAAVPDMFVAGVNESSDVQIKRYKFASNTWEDQKPIGIKIRGGYHIHFIDECLYLFACTGGNKVVCIPLATMKAENKKAMNTVKKDYTCVAYGQFVYCIGGRNEKLTLDSVERYDTKKDVCKKTGKLNQGRSKAHAAVLAGKIYVVGGFAAAALRSVERYDPKTGHWTTVAHLNVARYKHRCCTIGEYMYAVGGRSSMSQWLASIERYDGQLDRWVIIQYELDVPLAHFEVAASGHWIHIAGGRGGDVLFSKDFRKINVLNGQIQNLASMNHEIKFLS